MTRHHILKRHRSARSLVREHLSKEIAAFGEDGLRMPAHPSYPDDGDFTYGEALTVIRRQRMWAFVRVPGDESEPATIHWWAHRDVPREDVAQMLGHELGHITGKILDDDAAEEDRADMYGEVARRVVQILRLS